MNVSMLERTLVRRLLAVSSVSFAAATLLVASPASAQDPAPAGEPAGAAAGGTDHAGVVGKLAVGWMGVNTVALGNGDYAPSSPGGKCGALNPGQTQSDTPCRPVLTGATTVSVPTIGVRYWLNERLGLDVGLGLAIQSGSTKSYPYPSDGNNGNFDVEWKRDSRSIFAGVIHAGVPIVLGEPGKHYTFTAIPEANVGFASGSQKEQPQPQPNGPNQTAVVIREELKTGGFRLDVGARLGAEIQFGFIGLPQLSLQGTVGLFFSTQSVRATVGGKDATQSSTTIGTSVQNAPWALFTNNIAALYYF
jgi:hypothetical protein